MDTSRNESRICEKGGQGIVLPQNPYEYTYPSSARGILYGIALAYCFLGVSIVADTFMGSIEAVTSRRRQVRLKSGRLVTVRVWNDTVANITLMALGSSAPEILLSVIELFKNDMYSGELGPSTIVGSAAFNLLVIVAICIVTIPNNETRKVRELNVLYITVAFSLFAYIWLVFIISVCTPGVVDFWEALVTFFCFPLLVGISWMADTGKFGKLLRRRQTTFTGMQNGHQVPDELLHKVLDGMGAGVTRSMDEDAIISIKKQVSEAELGSDPSSLDIEALVDSLKPRLNMPRKSRATHRIEATRALTHAGGKKSYCSRDSVGALAYGSRNSDGHTGVSQHSMDVAATFGASHSRGARNSLTSIGSANTFQTTTSEDRNSISFTCDHQCFSRNLTQKPIVVTRAGDISFDVVVKYAVHCVTSEPDCTMFLGMPVDSGNRTGNAYRVDNDSDYHLALFLAGSEVSFGSVTFQAGEVRKTVIVDRPTSIPIGHGEDFAVRLRSVEPVGVGSSSESISMGAIAMTHVSMAQAGSAGKISFAEERMFVQSTTESQPLQAQVIRRGGCCGTVNVNFRTERLNAIPGFDYTDVDGTLEFAEGVTEQAIDLEILPKGANQSSDEFIVFLSDCEGGAEFDPSDDGGAESSILTVSIGALDIETSTSGNLLRWMDRKVVNIAEFKLGARDWKEQVTSSIYIGGSREEQAQASKVDWIFHLMSLPWKLLFTLVPPTSFCNGWVCFYVSLLMIGVVTGIIGDIAELFGCVFDVPDSVTAITFVALGTSMPDLFASQSAAIQDPWADASICNVTGSNSVNVFLGLGLPWTVGALHWNMTTRTAKWESEYPDVAARLPTNQAAFVVPAGNLGFSVFIFCCASLVALGLLQLRRKRLGCELGGPWKEKVSCAVSFITLWFGYITLASWQVLRWDDASDTERSVVILSVILIALGVAVVPTYFLLVYKAPLVQEKTSAVNSDISDLKVSSMVAAPQDTDGEIESDCTRSNEEMSQPSESFAGKAFSVEPQDVAIGMTAADWTSNEPRSPPLKHRDDLEGFVFGGRGPTQPPLTPTAQLDLMAAEQPTTMRCIAAIPMNTKFDL